MNQPSSVPEQYDAVVVGAGFSGLYMLYRLRQLGLSAKVFDSAGDVGGTWYWNRYPGARCDIPTTDYTYSFDPELEKEWTWSEKYATQPEILDYLRFVADRYGMRSDIEFSATVTSAGEAVRRERFEAAWEQGELFGILNVFADQGVNPASNDIVAEMIREKIRAIVKDPATAEALCPKDHYFGTKRPCLDTGYFETFNLPHVRLVDLRKQPIVSITEEGIETADESFGFDAIVYATGFDAMTGALVAADVAGRDGLSLKEKWATGPSTYLGLMTAGFPNLFILTGPGSPSVLSNMTVSIEQHVDWVAGCLKDMREEGFETIEPTALAESGWNQHVQDCAAITLHPTAKSWYMGANVPGKPRVFLPYIGGVNAYRQACDEVVGPGYLGFRMIGPGGVRCRDG